ncbi:MAG: hypothetical protein AAF580_13375 [Pseudomonadota bacterium]
MTEAEETSVRAELHQFRAEWEDAQRRRGVERRWAIGVIAPIAAMYIAATITWGWNISAAVALNTERVEQGTVVDERRFSHETRITVLESHLVRIDNNLAEILQELREQRTQAR